MASSAATSAPGPQRPDPYAAWRIGNYRLYATSWFAMTIARQIETVAIGVYIYATTGNVLDLGILGLVQAVPAMLFAIPGGQLADRFDRRLVLATVLVLAAALTAGLGAACYFQVSPAWIYPLLIVNAMCQALGAPSRTALLPWIVPAAKFSNAVSWNSTIFHVATMVGPVLGGLLLSVSTGWGTSLALSVVFAGRLLALLGTLMLPTHRPEARDTTISLASLAAGIRFVWKQKVILATITLDLFAVLLGGATYLLPAFAEDVLHFSKEHVGTAVGLLRSAEAAGAIAMAVLIAHRPPIRRAGVTLLRAVAGFGAATMVFGLSRNFWLSMAAMFAIGALDNISVVVRHTLVQLLTPDAMRGRVSAVNNVFIVASNDLGGLESGVTAWLFGLVPSVVGGGIGAILVVLTCAARWPQILTIGSLADLRPAEDAKALQEADEEIATR